MNFYRESLNFACNSLYLYYTGQDQERGGHRF